MRIVYPFTFNGLLDDFKMNRENEYSLLDYSNVFALTIFNLKFCP